MAGDWEGHCKPHLRGLHSPHSPCALLCGLCLVLHIFSGTLSLVGVFCSCGNPIEVALQFYIISGKRSKSVIRNRFLSYVSPWGCLSHSASVQPTNLCKVQDSFNFAGDFSGDKLKRPFHFLELVRVLLSSPCHSFAVRQHMSVLKATQFVVLCSPSKLTLPFVQNGKQQVSTN